MDVWCTLEWLTMGWPRLPLARLLQLFRNFFQKLRLRRIFQLTQVIGCKRLVTPGATKLAQPLASSGLVKTQGAILKFLKNKALRHCCRRRAWERRRLARPDAAGTAALPAGSGVSRPRSHYR